MDSFSSVLLKLFPPVRVYLDYAAATPLDPAVASSMARISGSVRSFANASSTHTEGREAKASLEEARRSIAELLSAHPDEIIFTSGATEADNLAIQGAVAASTFSTPHIISTEIEHSATRETLRVLEHGGVSITRLPVDVDGRINPDDLKKALRAETVLVTFALGNSEIGTIQPIRDIVRVVKEFRSRAKQSHFPYLHFDVSQAVNFIPVGKEALGADLVTIDGAKIYGPKGVGLLYVKRGTVIKPIMYGGGQERGLRPGTENIAGAVGLAKALELAVLRREKDTAVIHTIGQYFIELLHHKIPDARIIAEKAERLPNFINVCIPGVEAEFMTVRLDARGIAASSASACRSIGGNGSSYVVAALPTLGGCASSAIRFTLGRFTTRRDVEHAVDTLSYLISHTAKL